ncbi:STAS domain-containing protein [Bacillus sp. NEB1478]|uniref:STAS domain-containing protein n=1 Tax=Bacillus sp. NEB1478 TaxID=3073816 RepID=UPI002872AEE2|nr:STAS domain-containing protein [Bacillus sp. NEB1478]WNB91013.1 STAS domain-containing protein [Bacillus sp. NEB1478]
MEEKLTDYEKLVPAKFKSIEEASTSILQLISEFVDVNTIFIAKNDKHTNKIIKVFNREEVLLEEGSILPFNETYCKLSVDNGRNPLLIPDINQNELTRNLNVTANLGSGSFIGIPVYFENGENYGTICGLDTKSIEFTDKHIHMFETFSSLLTYILELDMANNAIHQLSVPIVPVVKGIAILPIIGNLYEARAQMLMEIVLNRSQTLSLNYLVIDLSGVSNIDNDVAHYLIHLVKALRLLGITPILTGIRPEMAIKVIQSNIEFDDVIIRANLEQALTYIGFSLNDNRK